MPRIRFPTSDIGRLALLERIHQTAIDDLAAGDGIIEQHIVDELAAFLAIYEPKVKAVYHALGRRSNAIQERRQATTKLETNIRDFFVVLKRRIKRLDQSVELWFKYGLSISGSLPDPRLPDELLQWAKRIVEGDAEAIEAGFDSMVNPSAGEVQTWMEIVKETTNAVAQADIAHNRAQKAAKTKRARADHLIRQANIMIAAKLYGRETANIRRIKRNFGYAYTYHYDETRDPDDPTPVGQNDILPQ